MAKINSIDSLKPWRWSNTLSVVDAAILMCLENPDDYFQSSDGERIRMNGQPEDYIASFSALTFAIERNEIQANIAHSIRSAKPRNKDHENVFDDLSSTNEVEVTYDMLINRNPNQTDLKTENTGQTFLNFNPSEINSKHSFYITQKPNWELTTVQFADMKSGLKTKMRFIHFFLQMRILSRSDQSNTHAILQNWHAWWQLGKQSNQFQITTMQNKLWKLGF